MILLGNPKYNYLITGDHPQNKKAFPGQKITGTNTTLKFLLKRVEDPLFYRLYKDGLPTLSLKRFLFH